MRPETAQSVSETVPPLTSMASVDTAGSASPAKHKKHKKDRHKDKVRLRPLLIPRLGD